MSVPQDPEEAKVLVEKIAEDNGFLGAQDYEGIPNLATRRKFQIRIMKLGEKLGSMVIRLATILYSSKARFVFELLQNADDNCYKRAKRLNQVSFLSFNKYHDRIVVDCNEDGFTAENLTAICSAGESSKTGAQGYIGEKGVGFKSVFMVAWKVHIQSAGFSFTFTHRPDEAGLGMVSPEWEPEREDLTPPLTRMTLYLLDEAMEEGTLKESIDRQFSDIQETFLLFMKNLKHVSVRLHDAAGRETSYTSYESKQGLFQAPNRAYLTKTTVIDNKTTETSYIFHLCTYEATNLAKNDNRTYSDEEEASRAWSKSQVKLAFPLTGVSVPIVKPQSLFVFMPVRFVGFNFIIHADFVTDGNRQDIVTDSARNRDLIDGVAAAYVKAVLQFCEHSPLRYQWMRYLPDRQRDDRGRLWHCLVDKIAALLAETPVVRSHSSDKLHRLSKLHHLEARHVDDDNEPLFKDVSETMLSRQYAESDACTLVKYGVKKVTYKQILLWLKQDLQRGTRSRMKSPSTGENWHTRVAKLLNTAFDKNNDVTEELKTMELVPLTDGTWTSASTTPVYFPDIDEFEIPSKIQLRVVDREVTDPLRLTLFKHLGVRSANLERVRKNIFKEYSAPLASVTVTLQESIEHLDFLIKTQDWVVSEETGLRNIAIYNTEEELVQPTNQYLYLTTDDPSGPWELLKETPSGLRPGDGAPGRPGSFLHSGYLQEVTGDPGQESIRSEWLHDKLEVERVLTFEVLRNGENVMSSEAKYLQKYRPEKFIGALRAWFQERNAISPGVIEELRSTEVLCRGGNLVPLCKAYFPTKELEKRVKRYVEPAVNFPWLWLGPDTPTQHSIPSEWRQLLDVLDVGRPDSDLEFALHMLEISVGALQDENELACISDETAPRILGLYQHIWSTYQEDGDEEAGKTMVRAKFVDDSCPIYIPAECSDKECTWASADDCLWDAPQLMVTKTVISLEWDRLLPDHVKFRHLEHFFTTVVGVGDCTYSTCVDELRGLKEEDNIDIDSITMWYEELDSLRQPEFTFLEDMRKPFEAEALIYAPSDQGPSWHKISQCVWSIASRLRGRPSLNDDYENLHSFFVEFLGVKPVDLGMVISELKEAGNEGSLEKVTDSIWTVNSLLRTVGEWPESTKASESRIFPVQLPSGQIKCMSKGAEFFLVDRESYRVAFKHQVKLLYFTLAEVAKLGPFLQWAKLEGRYISNCVKEVTSFGGGDAILIVDSESQISNRAHALLRIAKQHGSPRARSRSSQESFYEVLSDAQTFGTDGIRSDIQLRHDGKPYTAKGKTNAVFIDDDGESRLKVYVPRHKREQKYAFTMKLPRKFFEWMMTDPQTQIREAISDKGVAATEHVFNAARTKLDETLEEDGIAAIDIENRDEPADSDTDSTSTASEDESFEAHTDPTVAIYPAIATRSQGVTVQEPEGPTAFDEDDNDASDTSTEGMITPSTITMSSTWQAAAASMTPMAIPIRTRPSLQPEDTVHLPEPPIDAPITAPRVLDDNARYSRLLERVIRAARETALPRSNTLEESRFRGAGDDGRPLRISGTTRFERDFKIGAAGELFVFEFLSHLGEANGPLPSFTRNNWKSNIREYARAHPDYADLEPWRGSETSDIVYPDSSGNLTAMLRDRGYFDAMWTAQNVERPKYFIEVKTTTSDYDAPLYMHKSQYARMQRCTLLPWNGEDIYVIFRVYNLGRDRMGLRVYLDPEGMRRRNELIFTAEQWSVVPRGD